LKPISCRNGILARLYVSLALKQKHEEKSSDNGDGSAD
jgi:hypothetical protein